MRTLMLALVVAGIMATVWFYAASATSENRTLDAIERDSAIGASTTAVVVAWVFSGGLVTGTKITWTPKDTTIYKLTVTAGNSTGTFTTGVTKANFTRTDSVPLPPTDPGVIANASVVITPVAR